VDVKYVRYKNHEIENAENSQVGYHKNAKCRVDLVHYKVVEIINMQTQSELLNNKCSTVQEFWNRQQRQIAD
jgi:hypothetical protein